MTKYIVTPSLIPDARLVRILETHLPPVCLDLQQIAKLANLCDPRGECKRQDVRYWDEADSARALSDLEERGLCERVTGHGWRATAKLMQRRPGHQLQVEQPVLDWREARHA